MKIIDNTPLVDEKGNLGFQQRIQGMLQYGFTWQVELQVQKVIVTFFDRNLDKGYTLLRNVTLGQSGIMIPITLLGPAGIFVINLIYQKGNYEVNGGSWNVESGNRYKPASVNLIQQTTTMARALQKFIERQGVNVPVNIEPLLIAGDPGVNVQSQKPAIRVILIDGIKSFASSLGMARPALNSQSVYELTERIINPLPPKKKPASPAPKAPPREAEESGNQPAPQDVSRARAIFNASEEAKPFNPSDFDFALTEESDPQALSDVPQQSAPARPVPTSATPRRRMFGMTPIQLVILAALALCLICVLVVGFVYVIPAFS